MRIKIISWNIWKGKNLNGVIDFLAKEKADIIGLQEVTEKDEDTGRINLASEIAKKLGYKIAFCRAFTTDRHIPGFDIGNAVLSKFKPESSRCIFLSSIDEYKGDSQTEPRVAVEVQFQIREKCLRVFTVHLSYSNQLKPSDLRKKQTERLLAYIKNQRTILMGDFNALPESWEIRKISKILKNVDDGNRFPTWSVYPADYEGFKVDKLKSRIDYMFCGSKIKVKKFSVGSSSASDHLPLIVVADI